MPRHKDLKRIIRTRMKKTGESYTAARARILSTTKTTEPAIDAARDAARAGMSDEKIAARTGRAWRQWVRTLDADGAGAMPHREIAALVHTKYGIGDWWAQTVTVGYERLKGLRERGQRRDGTYEATRSRTFAVPVAALFAAWATPAKRRQWLDGIKPVVRTATAPKSMRLQWPDGTLVAVGFFAKGAGRSSVAIGHAKLRDRASVAAAKAYWAARFDALASSLGVK